MSKYFPEGPEKSIAKEESTVKKANAVINAIKDKIQGYVIERWIVLLILIVLYIIRVFIIKGYFALTYCIGINILNSFIGFISPLEDPDDVEIDEGSFLPEKASEEFKPFQRKVKEFQFWEICFFTMLIGNILTFFEAFDIPVFWPLLLFYFILIFYLTMRKQIAHMIKYNYLPWDSGKTRYEPKK